MNEVIETYKAYIRLNDKHRKESVALGWSSICLGVLASIPAVLLGLGGDCVRAITIALNALFLGCLAGMCFRDARNCLKSIAWAKSRIAEEREYEAPLKGRCITLRDPKTRESAEWEERQSQIDKDTANAAEEIGWDNVAYIEDSVDHFKKLPVHQKAYEKWLRDHPKPPQEDGDPSIVRD